jgi:hypothetical protein
VERKIELFGAVTSLHELVTTKYQSQPQGVLMLSGSCKRGYEGGGGGDNGDGTVADADMDVAVTVAKVQRGCRRNNDGGGGAVGGGVHSHHNGVARSWPVFAATNSAPSMRGVDLVVGQEEGVGVGTKVVAYFKGRMGCQGWYDATVTQVNEQGDAYVVVWEDGEKRDTQKASWEISIPLNQIRNQQHAKQAVPTVTKNTVAVECLMCREQEVKMQRHKAELVKARRDIQELIETQSTLYFNLNNAQAELLKSRSALAVERSERGSEREELQVAVQRQEVEKERLDGELQGERAARERVCTLFGRERTAWEAERGKIMSDNLAAISLLCQELTLTLRSKKTEKEVESVKSERTLASLSATTLRMSCVLSVLGIPSLP